MQRELVWLVTVLLNALKISWKARLSSMQSNPFGRLKILLAFHLGSFHCTVLNATSIGRRGQIRYRESNQ